MFEEFDNDNENQPKHSNASGIIEVKNKSPFSKGFRIVAIAFIVLLFFAIGIIIGTFAINNSSADLALLNEIKKIVDTYYYGDIDWNNVDLNSANAMLHYISQFNGISVENSGVSEGVYGLSLYVNSYNSRYVKYVQPRSVASNANGKRVAVSKLNNESGLIVQEIIGNNADYSILRGDKIYAMLPYSIKNSNSENDYILLDGMGDTAYSDIMSIKDGWIVFERTVNSGAKEYFEFHYSKSASGAHYSSYSTINGRDDIGYIDLTTFSDESLISLYTSVREYVEDNKANKLILDLRGNGGGSVDVFQKIASLFVPHTTIALPAMKLEDKNGAYDIRKLTYGAYSGLKSDYIGNYKQNISPYDLIVLVDGNSASASEALCGVINCYNERALIIGTDTYGKGVAQSEFEFDGGNIKMRLVTAKYYVPVNDGTAWQNFHGKSIPIDYNFNTKENQANLSKSDIFNFGRPCFDLKDDIVVAKAIEFFDTIK